ncbi:MAG: hypothetical protein AAGE52_26685, partial [Myxococcota bacterium]
VIESADNRIASISRQSCEDVIDAEEDARSARAETERLELILLDARKALGLRVSTAGFVEACKEIRKRIDKVAEILGMG